MQDIPDYFDPHVLARQEGYNRGEMIGRDAGYASGHDAGYASGHEDGHAEGYTSGHKAGYTSGHKVGYTEGWNAAIARANEEILKQMEFTRQHVADKETMTQQLREQRELIDQLTQRLDEMEQENVNLKKTNAGLRQVVTALKEANERLQADVEKMDDKLRSKTKEYSDQIWQYNRCMVFMNAVRSTLEELTIGNGSQAKQVREKFAEKYSQSVSNALAKGAIQLPPDQDESFARNMPKTNKFIVDILSSVAANAPKEIRDRMMQQLEEDHDLDEKDEHHFGM